MEYNLSISNTQFQHHPRYLYTWKSPGDVRRNQIDYIMIKQRFKNSIINVKTLPGADINSDHCLLAAKIKLKLKVPKQSKVQAQYDLNTLKDSTIRAKYNIDIKNKFQMLRIEETEQTGITDKIENKWSNIKESITNYVLYLPNSVSGK